MMGVAQRVPDGRQPVIGREMIVDDDAPRRPWANAALADTDTRSAPRSRRWKPLALPATRKPVSSRWRTAAWATSAAIRAATAPEFLGLPLAPGDDAVGTKPRRAEQVGHRLRHSVLGNELLHIEIDRRRPHARAILSRRDHPLRETRRGLAAAAGAAIDHRLMFGDLQSRLGQIKHLPLLGSRDHRPRQPAQAMATGLRLVPLDHIGRGHRLQRAAGVARLPAARSCPTCRGKRPAIRGGFFKPSLDGGLLLFELFLSS